MMEQRELGGKILQELEAIAFARPGDYWAMEEGQLRLRDWQGLTERQLAAVAGVEKGTGGVKLKLYDKMKALELMGKILGIFEESPVLVEENNLLQAILNATVEEVDTDDIPEAIQATADRHDLVEPAGAAAV